MSGVFSPAVPSPHADMRYGSISVPGTPDDTVTSASLDTRMQELCTGRLTELRNGVQMLLDYFTGTDDDEHLGARR